VRRSPTDDLATVSLLARERDRMETKILNNKQIKTMKNENDSLYVTLGFGGSLQLRKNGNIIQTLAGMNFTDATFQNNVVIAHTKDSEYQYEVKNNNLRLLFTRPL